MMRSLSVYFVLLLMLSIISCARQVTSSATSQGVCGVVLVKRGNHMPGPDSPPSPGQPAERLVLIFPLLNRSQIVVGDNGFITSVGDAKPVKTVMTDKKGNFCVSLPAGRYSVVVREPKGLYANLFDTQNNIFPVTVKKGEQVTIAVEITHQASF